MCDYCKYCCNSAVEPDLSSDNDLSYLSVGETTKGYGLYIRSGDNRPTVLIFSKFYNSIKQNLDVCIYKMKYCPECGRKLIENKW